MLREKSERKIFAFIADSAPNQYSANERVVIVNFIDGHRTTLRTSRLVCDLLTSKQIKIILLRIGQANMTQQADVG